MTILHRQEGHDPDFYESTYKPGPDTTYHMARHHAVTCKRCSMPIVDVDGNPGYYGEACPEGIRLLRAYEEALA